MAIDLQVHGTTLVGLGDRAIAIFDRYSIQDAEYGGIWGRHLIHWYVAMLTSVPRLSLWETGRWVGGARHRCSCPSPLYPKSDRETERNGERDKRQCMPMNDAIHVLYMYF